MSQRLPRQSDFIVYGDLDEQAACRDFLGKTREEVRALLEDNFLYYQEHFMFMGVNAFCYYIDAMIGYIAASSFDEHEAHMFHAVCKFRLETDDEKLAPCAGKVASGLNWVAQQMEHYGMGGTEEVRHTRDVYRRLSKLRGSSGEA